MTCGVTLPIDVGHIILGRRWLFNLDVTIYGWTNHCSFGHNDKRVKLMPNQPKLPTPEKKVDKDKGKMTKMNLISSEQLEHILNEGLTC